MTPPLISSNPEIMGGAWCISGTRIPAKAVKSFHDYGYTCDRIREEYPGLCNDQIYAAIEFKEPSLMEETPMDDAPDELWLKLILDYPRCRRNRSGNACTCYERRA